MITKQILEYKVNLQISIIFLYTRDRKIESKILKLLDFKWIKNKLYKNTIKNICVKLMQLKLKNFSDRH